MKNIFLSASIPVENRNPQYYNSADKEAIVRAVRALASVIIPETHLVWGGHPAITPIIRSELSKQHKDVKDHVTLYQSEYFKDFFPADNGSFERVVLTPESGGRQESLETMRQQMIGDNDFSAAIFIGGMEGVKEEFELFRTMHPNATLLPIASTGAAARSIYEELKEEKKAPTERLENERTYRPLFKALLREYIKPAL